MVVCYLSKLIPYVFVNFHSYKDPPFGSVPYQWVCILILCEVAFVAMYVLVAICEWDSDGLQSL